jgi:hypothetical protein
MADLLRLKGSLSGTGGGLRFSQRMELLPDSTGWLSEVADNWLPKCEGGFDFEGCLFPEVGVDLLLKIAGVIGFDSAGCLTSGFAYS